MALKITRCSWIILVLVLINLATLATVWLRPAVLQRPRPVAAMWEKELALDAGQAAQFRNEIHRHRAAMESLFRKMGNTREHLLRSLSASQPDILQAHRFADSTAAVQRQLDLQFIQHYLALRSYCTPEQLKNLNHIFSETIHHGPERPPQHPHKPAQ